MVNENEILERLEKLEKAVFGNIKQNEQNEQGKQNMQSEIKNNFNSVMSSVIELLTPFKDNYPSEDWVVFDVVIPKDNYRADAQLTSFCTLREEESDEDIARLCGALASKQRISIIKQIATKSLGSGELAELTGMAGGHMHHHLKDLLALGLVTKDNEGKYKATYYGVNAYIAVAALYRRLSFENREDFRKNLNEI